MIKTNSSNRPSQTAYTQPLNEKMHPFRKGLKSYNKIIVTPLNQSNKGKVTLVCLKIICIVTAPISYPVLGFFDLIGRISDHFRRNSPPLDKHHTTKPLSNAKEEFGQVAGRINDKANSTLLDSKPSSKISKQSISRRGIINKGNSCHLSSALQLLASIPNHPFDPQKNPLKQRPNESQEEFNRRKALQQEGHQILQELTSGDHTKPYSGIYSFQTKVVREVLKEQDITAQRDSYDIILSLLRYLDSLPKLYTFKIDDYNPPLENWNEDDKKFFHARFKRPGLFFNLHRSTSLDTSLKEHLTDFGKFKERNYTAQLKIKIIDTQIPLFVSVEERLDGSNDSMEIPFQWSPDEEGPVYQLRALCVGGSNHWRAVILNPDGTCSLCDDSKVKLISQKELKKLVAKKGLFLAYTV